MAVAMEYVLEPAAEHVDVSMRVGYTGDRGVLAKPFVLAAQRARMPAYARGEGFEPTIGADFPYIGYVRDGATSYAYSRLDGEMLDPGVSASGFQSNVTGEFTIDACTVSPSWPAT
jgi:hypothetical protein